MVDHGIVQFFCAGCVNGERDLSPHAKVKVVDEEGLAEFADGVGGEEAGEEAEREELDDGGILVRGAGSDDGDKEAPASVLDFTPVFASVNGGVNDARSEWLNGWDDPIIFFHLLTWRRFEKISRRISRLGGCSL